MSLDRIKSFFGMGKRKEGNVGRLAVIKEGAKIGPDVQIEGGCYIASTASILDQAVVASSHIESADIFGSAQVYGSSCGDPYAWRFCRIFDRAIVRDSTIESGEVYGDAQLGLVDMLTSVVRGYARIHYARVAASVIEGDVNVNAAVHKVRLSIYEVWWWHDVP